MKKLIALVSTMAMAVSLAGCSSSGNDQSAASASAGVSGTFEGTAQGKGGDVTVALTLTDSKITDVSIEGKDETPGIGDTAMETMAQDRRSRIPEVSELIRFPVLRLPVMQFWKQQLQL